MPIPHQKLAFPAGKSPDRAIKQQIHRSREADREGHHHSEEGEPGYSSKLTPRLAKVWQQLKRAANRRTRHAPIGDNEQE